jgi:hypothetical protein
MENVDNNLSEKLFLNPKDIPNFLLSKLDTDTNANRFPETREKLVYAYKQLPAFSEKAVNAYYHLCAQYNLDPGEIRLYMVGGRVRGTPLKEDSDIDLVFAVENYQQSIEHLHFDRFSDPGDAQQFKIDRMLEINTRVFAISHELGIAKGTMHILGYGDKFPQTDIRKDILLLGKRSTNEPQHSS